MLRPRLRVARSCQWCRQHRKKCDGKRPHCGPCVSRGYLCSWTKGTVSKLLKTSTFPEVSDLVQDCISNVDSSHCSPASQSPTLNGVPYDSSWVNPETLPTIETVVDFAAIRDGHGSGQRSLASTTDFGNHFDEHIIISGVLHGWNFVRSRFLLDSQWPHVIFFDRELVKIGYPPVHRMAALWFGRMKMKVSQAGPCRLFRI